MLQAHTELIQALDSADEDILTQIKRKVPVSTLYSQALGHARALSMILKEAETKELSDANKQG